MNWHLRSRASSSITLWGSKSYQKCIKSSIPLPEKGHLDAPRKPTNTLLLICNFCTQDFPLRYYGSMTIYTEPFLNHHQCEASFRFGATLGRECLSEGSPHALTTASTAHSPAHSQTGVMPTPHTSPGLHHLLQQRIPEVNYILCGKSTCYCHLI